MLINTRLPTSNIFLVQLPIQYTSTKPTYHCESPLHRVHSQSALAWYSANGVGHAFQHHFPLIFTFMYDFAITLVEVPCIYNVYTKFQQYIYSTHSNEHPTQITWNVSGPAADINSGSSLTLEWIREPHRVQDASDIVFTFWI